MQLFSLWNGKNLTFVFIGISRIANYRRGRTANMGAGRQGVGAGRLWVGGRKK